ncbi:endolytic transglycosylase MltG [Lutimonas zeaxanthinifaciens]|uniref:endolytic transglycosylase MltG n=1 Tax=Lutimonas zeaxanthinifaciens TaxID=3060215 RepID=UPI00265D039A|nr:endolytic transglycosylase MltG [Lutimonas sp. YSD2104]WKK65029.1 endolytic transglycosylase MltG [Lutimonas sp. YSD2104]
MKKKIAISLGILFLMLCIIGYSFYRKIYAPNVKETVSIYIPTGTTMNELIPIIDPYIRNINGFIWVAEKKNYPNRIRPGKFRISEGMSNEELINHLRGGKAETITLTFNNQDSFEKLAGRVANQIEADSTALFEAFKDVDFITKNGFTPETAIAMYIPNSYDFYWNTSPNEFRDRMLTEYKRFWTDARREKAKAQNLNPLQVSTLASIVQKETAIIEERKTVAGLYLNRLHDFWPLQADPTIIFALKQKYGQEKEYKRVLNKDLDIDSPYNTYANFGLPPGPIGMPDISSIDAVLNPENHKYYYMCASVEKMGYHKFAKTLKEHNTNATAYQRWVSQQGINR